MKESEIQRAAIKLIKAKYPDSVIIANPFSEIEMSSKNKFAKIARLKSQGWQAGQPDLMIFAGGKSIAIELKTPKTDPFRPFRGGGMWIDKSKSLEQVEHVLKQFFFMWRLDMYGNFDSFCLTSAESALKAVDAVLTCGVYPQFQMYEFSYSLESDCWVWCEKK